MARRTAHVAAIGGLLAASLGSGCGSSEPEALPVACLGAPATIARALERAPGKVTLSDGTSLSHCVRVAAARDGDLQTLGTTLTRVADDLQLAARSDPAAALRLGYLTGAVRRGAAKTPGLAAQLARRIEQTTALRDPAPATSAALRRGIGLGEAGG